MGCIIGPAVGGFFSGVEIIKGFPYVLVMLQNEEEKRKKNIALLLFDHHHAHTTHLYLLRYDIISYHDYHAHTHTHTHEPMAEQLRPYDNHTHNHARANYNYFNNVPHATHLYNLPLPSAFYHVPMRVHADHNGGDGNGGS